MEKASETVAREEHQAVVRRVEALERALAPRPWSNRDRAILAGGLAGIFALVFCAILAWGLAERGRRLAFEEQIQPALEALESAR